MLAIAAAISIETAVNNLHSRELEIRTSGGAYIPVCTGISLQHQCTYVTDENGDPVRYRVFYGMYRDVADAASVPKEVWNARVRQVAAPKPEPQEPRSRTPPTIRRSRTWKARDGIILTAMLRRRGAWREVESTYDAMRAILIDFAAAPSFIAGTSLAPRKNGTRQARPENLAQQRATASKCAGRTIYLP